MLMNGDLALKAAKSWSTSILADPSLETPEERVTQIFLQAYSRPPSPAELETCLQYLNPANSNAEADDTDEIREAYFRIAHAMLNSKELIYVH